MKHLRGFLSQDLLFRWSLDNSIRERIGDRVLFVKYVFFVAAAALTVTSCDQFSRQETDDLKSVSRESGAFDTTGASIVDDPYLWLEEVEGERALEWVETQNERSKAYLASNDRYDTLYNEALAILNSKNRIPYGNLRGNFVYNFWQDENNIRGVWRRATLETYMTDNPEWEFLLSIDALAEDEEENWVFKGASCLAPAYDRCMVTLSRGGKDAAVLREFSIGEGRFVRGGFEVHEAKSNFAWIDDNTLLISTEWGDGALTESGYPRVVKSWTRGTPLAAAKTVFEGKTEDVGVWAAATHRKEGVIPLIIRAVTFYESEFYVAQGATFEKVPLPRKTEIVDIVDGSALATLQQDWTYKSVAYPQGALISFDLETKKASLIFAPGEREAIQNVEATASAVFVQTLDDVTGKLWRFEDSGNGWKRQKMGVPVNGVVSIASANAFRDDLMINFESPAQPDTLYYMNETGEIEVIKTLPAMFDATNVVIDQREAISSDGTQIPYFVIADRATLHADAEAPVHLYAYGGFEVPLLPRYSATVGKLWIERGGVYVIANLRGGGEFGPSWHQAGLKTNRQKVFDDFYAVAEDLIERGVATPRTLGISGGSNGGLLMGVALTQRPGLFGAVAINVPLLDMLRYNQLLAGASWEGEYGDPAVPEEREFLANYSPYHNLDQNADYPVTFVYTSTKDDRVHPGHARKFAARMDEQGHDFLYFENMEGGHAGAANNKQTAMRLALQYNYFFDRLVDTEERLPH